MISCLTEQLNGESCSSVAECLVTGAICNRGTCECPDTRYLQGTSCMDSKYSIRTASANPAKFCGIRPRMYIDDLL